MVEDLNDQKSLNRWQNLHGVLHDINAPCFVVYRILRQAHFKKVGLTQDQNQRNMTLENLKTLDL